ncbi:ABC transporter substrate-binding protein [Sinomonas sp. G460-2]|uniref:ABC transporter substrate-binding protein n=1 Tax=Sinomonas sp. G460-2 TaxID=3393464 RepID=UPI0039F12E91
MFKIDRRHSAPTIGAAALAAATLLLATACAPSASESSSRTHSGGHGDTLTIATANAPATLDPALMGAGNYMIWTSELGYDSLIHLAGDGSYQPDLAAKWEYKGLNEFDITLRDNVTFADGTTLNADAVAASLNYAFKAAGATQAWAHNVTEAKVAGPMTVSIACKASCPELPFLLSQNVQLGSIISPAGLADPKALSTATFGAGPYILNKSQSVTGDHYTFDSNPKYWNQAAIHFNHVVLRVIANDNARLSSLKAGQVDIVDNVPFQSAASVKAGGAAVASPPTGFLGIEFLDRTGQLQPELADVRVRQALNYAVDRDAIVKALGYDHATPTEQMTGSGSGAYDPALDKTYPYDPQKAKQLLTEAGYPNGFTIKLETQVPMPHVSNYTQAVMSQWEKIGVKTDLTSDQTFPAWIDNIAAKKFPGASYLYGTLPFSLQSTSFYTNTGGPYNAYKTDPKVDEMLKAASAAPGDQATEIYKQINKYSVEQAFSVPLAQVDVLYAANKTVNLPGGSATNAVPILTDVTAN